MIVFFDEENEVDAIGYIYNTPCTFGDEPLKRLPEFQY